MHVYLLYVTRKILSNRLDFRAFTDTNSSIILKSMCHANAESKQRFANRETLDCVEQGTRDFHSRSRLP